MKMGYGLYFVPFYKCFCQLRGDMDCILCLSKCFCQLRGDKYPLQYCKRFTSLYGLRLTLSRFDIRARAGGSIIGICDSCQVKKNGLDPIIIKDSLLRYRGG